MNLYEYETRQALIANNSKIDASTANFYLKIKKFFVITIIKPNKLLIFTKLTKP